MGGLNNPSPQVIPYSPKIPSIYSRPRGVGEYHGPFGAGMSNQGAARPADIIYAVPFMVLNTETFDRIATYINAAVTGKGVMGVYTDNDGSPNAKLLNTSEIDTGTIGMQEVAINLTLNPGLYWLVILFNVAANVRYYTNFANLINLPGAITNGGSNLGYATPYVYNTALPDPHPAAIPNTYYTPIIAMRRA